MSTRHIHAKPGEHVVVHRHHDYGNDGKWIVIGALVLIGAIVLYHYWQIIFGILILGALCGSSRR